MYTLTHSLTNMTIYAANTLWHLVDGCTFYVPGTVLWSYVFLLMNVFSCAHTCNAPREPLLSCLCPCSFLCLCPCSFLPAFLPSWLTYYFPCFLNMFLPFFLPSYIPSFLRNFLLSYLTTFPIKKCLPSSLPSFLPQYIPFLTHRSIDHSVVPRTGDARVRDNAGRGLVQLRHLRLWLPCQVCIGWSTHPLVF